MSIPKEKAKSTTRRKPRERGLDIQKAQAKDTISEIREKRKAGASLDDACAAVNEENRKRWEQRRKEFIEGIADDARREWPDQAPDMEDIWQVLRQRYQRLEHALRDSEASTVDVAMVAYSAGILEGEFQCLLKRATIHRPSEKRSGRVKDRIEVFLRAYREWERLTPELQRRKSVEQFLPAGFEYTQYQKRRAMTEVRKIVAAEK